MSSAGIDTVLLELKKNLKEPEDVTKNFTQIAMLA